MNDTVSLLKETNAGCKSATNAMEQIMPHIEDPKLLNLVEDYNTRHARIGEECGARLHEMNEQDKDPHAIASAMARMSIGIQSNLNPGQEKLADMLVDGCAMGIRSLAHYKNRYPAASADTVRLADELIAVERDFMMDLLPYV